MSEFPEFSVPEEDMSGPKQDFERDVYRRAAAEDRTASESAFAIPEQRTQSAEGENFSPARAISLRRASAPSAEAIGTVFLCRASGEGAHNFRICADAESVAAFYKEMFGEDQGGGIDSFHRTWRDGDEWCGEEGSRSLRMDLYCARFEVWQVDAKELSVRSSGAFASERVNAVIRNLRAGTWTWNVIQDAIACLESPPSAAPAAAVALTEDDEQFLGEAREIVARGDAATRYDAKDRLDYRRAALLLKLAGRGVSATGEKS